MKRENETTDIEALVERIREKALGKTKAPAPKPPREAVLAYDSSSEELVMEALSEGSSKNHKKDPSLDRMWRGSQLQSKRLSKVASQLAQTQKSFQVFRQHRLSLSKSATEKEELGSRIKTAKEAGQVNDQEGRILFQTEMEFLLHYLWSQKGYEIEDNADEYFNLRNLQSSQMMRESPKSQQAAHRNSHLNKSADPNYLRNERAGYQNRVPLSFNFQVPETLVVAEGQIKRWYYSTETGQLRIRNPLKHDWVELLAERIDDNTTPCMLTYRNVPSNNVRVSAGGPEEPQLFGRVVKDIVSAHRATQLAKHVADAGFPKEIHLVQQMREAADLTPPADHWNPNEKPAENVAARHELYECQWEQARDELKLFRIRNLLKKKSMHVASSKSQMSAQLKPIRLKHGTPNPAKALLLKLSIPQQLMYLTFEEKQDMAERLMIYPDPVGKFATLDVRRQSALTDSAQRYEPNPGSEAPAERISGKRNSQGASQSNFFSPKNTKLQQERLEIGIVAEELEREVRTALRLMQAQFKLHQLGLEKGTFYFQWVPDGDSSKRDPTTTARKRLHLVYCKDLQVRNKKQKQLRLPRRLVSYHRDVLTAHFFGLISAHESLRAKERNHTDKCQCQIQIDLQPKVRPLIQSIYARLAALKPAHYQLKFMEETVLAAFGYLLNIRQSLEQEQRKKQALSERTQVTIAEKNPEFLVEASSANCLLCDETLSRHSAQYSLPLMHLVFMPEQEQFLESLGKTLPLASRQQLLFSNKDLPPLLRLFVPSVETVDQFRRLQEDKLWLTQQVPLSKNCFKRLSKLIVELARQSERLSKVQEQFQNQLLQILRKGKKTSSAAKKNSRDQVSRQIAAEAKGASKESKGSIQESSRECSSFTHVVVTPDLPLSSSRKELARKANRSSSKQDGSVSLFLETAKRTSRKQVGQQIASKLASQGYPTRTVQTKSRQVTVELVSSGSERSVEQLLEKMRNQEINSQEVNLKIKRIRPPARKVSHEDGGQSGNRESFSQQQQKRLDMTKSQPVLPKVSRRNSQDSTLSRKGRFSSLRAQVDKQKQSKAIAHKQHDSSNLLGRLTNARITKSIPTKQRLVEQRILLEQMQLLGDPTFKQENLKPLAYERSLYREIKNPLFEHVLPQITSHRDLNSTLGETSKMDQDQALLTRQKSMLSAREPADLTAMGSSQIFEQLKTEESPRKQLLKELSEPLIKKQAGVKSKKQEQVQKRAKNGQGRKDGDIVAQLIQQHAPHLAIKLAATTSVQKSPRAPSQLDRDLKRIQTQSQVEKLQTGSSSAVLETSDEQEAIKQRRRALVSQIKQLKDKQIEKSLQRLSLAQFADTVRRPSRALTLRERNSMSPQRANAPYELTASGLPLNDQLSSTVEDSMREMVMAKSLLDQEIGRLTLDPIFGKINHLEIMNADKMIRNARIKQDPEFKEAMRKYAQKVKHPITEEDFALKQEDDKVKECEGLVRKMAGVLQSHQICQPAALASHREFKISSRIHQLQPQFRKKSKKRTKNASKSKKTQQTPAEVKQEAFNAIKMIETLRERENEISIEEARFNERRMSQRATMLAEFGPRDSIAIPLKTGASRNSLAGKGNFQKMQAETLNKQRISDVIQLQQQASEQDAANQIALGASLASLNRIDSNIQRVGRMLGRSQTVDKLHKVGRKKAYQNLQGTKLTVGAGREKVTASNQRQANVLNLARQSTNASFSIKDLFNA